jgi:hypothetical protein
MDVRALLAVHRAPHPGVDDDVVARVAWIAADVAHEACVQLRHSVRTLAVAQLLVQRCYAAISPREVDAPTAAAAATLLAGKIDDDALRPLAAVAVVVDSLWSARMSGARGRVLRVRGARWSAWLDEIIHAEGRLLAAIGFAVHAVVFSPAQTLVPYIARAVGFDPSVAREAIAVLNSVGRTDVLLRFCPEVAVCAALQVALKRLGMSDAEMEALAGDGRRWFVFFVFHCEATESDVLEAQREMQRVIDHPLCAPDACLPSLRDSAAFVQRMDDEESTLLARELYGIRVVQSMSEPTSSVPPTLPSSSTAGAKRSRFGDPI